MMTTIYIPVLVDTGDDYDIELMPYSGDNREGYEESELNQRCVLYSDYATLEAKLKAAQEREEEARAHIRESAYQRRRYEIELEQTLLKIRDISKHDGGREIYDIADQALQQHDEE